MGQYYKVINVDKKEYISPWDFDSGAKLLEWSYICSDGHANHFVAKMVQLMTGSWKGDRVYVVGDYAELEGQENTAYAASLADLEYDLEWLGKYDENEDRAPLYFCDKYGFVQIFPDGTEEDYICPRYAINTRYGCYIDLRNLPCEWTYTRDDNTEVMVSIFPVALLLAMGNGLGGGDYYGLNVDLCGSWTELSRFTRFSDSDAVLDLFQEYKPDFTDVRKRLAV